MPPAPVTVIVQPTMPVDNYHPGHHADHDGVDGIPPDQIRIGNVGELLVGGITGYANHAPIADALAKLKTDGFKNLADYKALGQASLKAGALSAGITAGVSAFQNIVAAAQGKIDGKDAVSNVTTDTVGGLLAGTTAGLGAGAASLALRSLGAGGLVLSIGASVAGALGGLAGNRLYDATGLRQRVFNSAQAFLN
jgi:hypothetical protein